MQTSHASLRIKKGRTSNYLGIGGGTVGLRLPRNSCPYVFPQRLSLGDVFALSLNDAAMLDFVHFKPAFSPKGLQDCGCYRFPHNSRFGDRVLEMEIQEMCLAKNQK